MNNIGKSSLKSESSVRTAVLFLFFILVSFSILIRVIYDVADVMSGRLVVYSGSWRSSEGIVGASHVPLYAFAFDLAVWLSPLVVIAWSFTIGSRIFERKSRPLGSDYPWIRSVAQKVAKELAIEKEPRLLYKETGEKNARTFGTNRDPKIVLTKPLIEELSNKPRELRAAFVHEYAHLINGDVSIWTRLQAFLSSYKWFTLVFIIYNVWVMFSLGFVWIGGSDRTEVFIKVIQTAGPKFLVLLAFLVVPYLISKSILRVREQMADATYLDLHGNPEDLVSVLLDINGDEEESILSLPFSDHPLLKSRIEAIRSKAFPTSGELPHLWTAFWIGNTLTFGVLMLIDILLSLVSLSLNGNEEILSQLYSLWGPQFYFAVEIAVPVLLISYIFCFGVSYRSMISSALKGAFCCFTYVGGLLVYYLVYHVLDELLARSRIPTISGLSNLSPEYIIWIFDLAEKISRDVWIVLYRFLAKPLEVLGPGLRYPISGWMAITIVIFCSFFGIQGFVILSRLLLARYRKSSLLVRLTSGMRHLVSIRKTRTIAFIIPQVLIVALIFYVQVPMTSRQSMLKTYLFSGTASEVRRPPSTLNYSIVAYFFDNDLETNFYVIDSLRILGALERPDLETREQVTSWLLFHVDPDGSVKSRYFWEAVDESFPGVDYAYYTIRSLKDLATVNIDTNAVVDFLTSRSYKYVDDVYLIVSSLNVLDTFEETNTSAVRSFVTSCQCLTKQNFSEPYATEEFMLNYGGFGLEPKGWWASMYATYCATSALKTLGYVNYSNSVATAEWILKHQTQNGGFCSELSLVWNRENSMPIGTEPTEPDVISTFYAVKALESLGKLDLIDKNKTIEYIASLQRRRGTFGYGLSNGYAYEDKMESVHKTTYMALSILESLNATEILNSAFPVQKALLEIFDELPLFFFISVVVVVCLDVFLRMKRII